MSFHESFFEIPRIQGIHDECYWWRKLVDCREEYINSRKNDVDLTFCANYETILSTIRPASICDSLENYAKITRDLKGSARAYSLIQGHNRERVCYRGRVAFEYFRCLS